jgi:hypothetical protein
MRRRVRTCLSASLCLLSLCLCFPVRVRVRLSLRVLYAVLWSCALLRLAAIKRSLHAYSLEEHEITPIVKVRGADADAILTTALYILHGESRMECTGGVRLTLAPTAARR